MPLYSGMHTAMACYQHTNLRARRYRTHALRLACMGLAWCAAWGCGAPLDVPVGPGMLPVHMWQLEALPEDVAHAHPQEMPPSQWASVRVPFCATAERADAACAHALQAARCAETQGQWHAALWACRCPAGTAFVPRQGCAPLPPVRAVQSFCTSLDWLAIKTACLRDLQIGRSAWHLHFAGRALRTQAVREALAEGDAGRLVGHTLSVPPATASWSMHLTDRLGPQAAPYLGFTDSHALVMPEQYTQAWVRPSTSALAHAEQATLARSCRKALATQGRVPADAITTLCAQAADGLALVQAASTSAWPTPDSTVWRTQAAAHMPPGAHLDALEWQLNASDLQDDATCDVLWRVVLRDEVVLGRALRVRWADKQTAAPHQSADFDTGRLTSWQLTLICDGAGVVQAWHIVSDQAPERTGKLLACHRMLKARKTKRATLVPGARAP